MEAIREPGLDDADAAERTDFRAEASTGVRQLRGCGDQILLAAIEEQLTLQ